MASYYYVYYRVNPTKNAELQAQIEAMQAKLEQLTGIRGSVLRKYNEPMLWMEVYEAVQDAPSFEEHLNMLVVYYKLNDFLVENSERKTEHFVA